MKRATRRVKATRRTTLTLPAAALRQAERIARSRNVNLSTVVGEALERDMRDRVDADGREDFLDAYRQAFGGLSEEQQMILDGIILQPKRR